MIEIPVETGRTNTTCGGSIRILKHDPCLPDGGDSWIEIDYDSDRKGGWRPMCDGPMITYSGKHCAVQPLYAGDKDDTLFVHENKFGPIRESVVSM